MKVNTDGVLLGAWGAVGSGAADILDIGTGTGVIALMAAQRNGSAVVDAVEIDPQTAEQAAENVAASPWRDRIRVFPRSLAQYVAECEKKYDHILSNPPYFVNSLKAPDAARSVARHADSLSYEELARSVAELLKPEGLFSVVLPAAEASVFTALAALQGLSALKRTEVRSRPDRPVSRVMLQFSRRPAGAVESASLTIETGEPGGFSEKYRELTAPFYLKF